MKPISVAIATPSAIVASGVVALLQRLRLSVVGEVRVVEPEGLESALASAPARVLFVDPLAVGPQRVASLRNILPPTAVVVALSTFLLPAAVVRGYDYALSVYDAPSAVADVITKACSEPDGSDDSRVLSQREKEVVTGIVKGLSNKEIAAEMNVSVNTVMTHRRNITSKLQIHSAAGLTIYAIVSKLVSLEEISLRRPL